MEIRRRVLFSIIIITFFTGLPVFLSGQTDQESEAPQYLFRNFTESKVLMKSGKVQNAILNYNTITGTMVYIERNDYYDMTNSEIVDTVFIQGSKFIPVKGAFYEVLTKGNMPLYRQVKSDLKPVGKEAGYGSKSQTSATTSFSSYSSSTGPNYNLKIPSDYEIETTVIYWLNKSVSFTTERQFLKLFPEKADDIKSYIKKNRLKFENKEDVIEIVKQCSDLYKTEKP